MSRASCRRAEVHSAMRAAKHRCAPACRGTGPTVLDYAGDEHRCVHQMFMEQARRTPHAVAIVGSQREYSYAEVDHLSNLLARRLRRGGAGAVAVSVNSAENSITGARMTTKRSRPFLGIVGIFLPHCAEYIIANIAIFKAGAAMLLLETSHTPSLIREVLKPKKLTVVITMAQMLEKLPSEATGVAEVEDDAWLCQGCSCRG